MIVVPPLSQQPPGQNAGAERLPPPGITFIPLFQVLLMRLNLPYYSEASSEEASSSLSMKELAKQ